MSKKRSFFFANISLPIALKTGSAFMLILLFMSGVSKDPLASSVEQTTQVTERTHQSRLLVQIKFPTLNHIVSLQTGGFFDGNWRISDQYAYHDRSSFLPGDDKQIVLYGHNSELIFGKISQLKNHDEVVITDDEGTEYTYQVKQTYIVLASDTSILDAEGQEQLIIYTCTGWMDRERLVIKAEKEF